MTNKATQLRQESEEWATEAAARLIGQKVEEIEQLTVIVDCLKSENIELGNRLHQANSLISRMQAYILPLADLADAARAAMDRMDRDIAVYSRSANGGNDGSD